MLLRIATPRPTLAERGAATIRRGIVAASTAIDAVVMWPFRTAEHRRTMATLAGLSDHDLRDIGLTRGDIRDSTALPRDRDPGAFLDGRRADRHGRW